MTDVSGRLAPRVGIRSFVCITPATRIVQSMPALVMDVAASKVIEFMMGLRMLQEGQV